MAVLEPGKYSSDPAVAAAQERVQLHREGELNDRIDAGLAEQVLRSELDEADFHQGKRVLAGLPTAERAQLERATLKDGSRAIHDPVTLKAVVLRALGPMPTTLEAIDAELEASRKRMADPRSGWFADDKAQLRYRILLRAKGNP